MSTLRALKKWVIVVSVGFLLAGPGLAIQKDKDKPKLKPIDPFDPKVQVPLTAASMIALQSGPGSIAIIRFGEINSTWTIEPPDPVSKVVDPVADRDMLKTVRDRTPVGRADTRAYAYLLALARDVPPAELRKAADLELNYSRVWDSPAQHRGKVMRIKGYLRRVTPMNVHPYLRKNEKIDKLYEAWIYGENDPQGTNPYLVVFTELPEGVPVNEKLMEQPVTAYAYFYKLYRYKVPRDKRRHDAPMFIGRTLLIPVVPAQHDISDDFKKYVIPFALISIMLLIFVGGGLLLWFRKGDRVVQSRISQTREGMFAVPEPDPEPGPPTEEPGEEPPAGGPSLSLD